MGTECAEHVWTPIPDHMACYRCACGAWGRKSIETGKINCTGTDREMGAPALTREARAFDGPTLCRVSDWLGVQVGTMEIETRAQIRRKHWQNRRMTNGTENRGS